jgi:predicted NBD/HSP70 family sugar kinase
MPSPARRANRSEAALLSQLSHVGPMSRAELSRKTGLPLSTVVDVAGRLIQDGLVREELGARNGRVGRPATVLRLTAAPGVVGVLAVARGGVQAAVISIDGQVPTTVDRRLEQTSSETTLAVAMELLDEALRRAGLGRDALVSTVLSLPAPVHDGRVVPPRNPLPGAPSSAGSTRARWMGPDWRAEVQRQLGVPAHVENDANLEALGEATYGAGQSSGGLVHIKLVGGLGAGVVLDRRLIRGAVGFAGELAHLHVDDDGPLCTCGGRGCLAGRADLCRIILLIQPAFDEEMTLDKTASLCAAGDRATRTIFFDLGRLIGRSLGSACLLLNPETMTIDGALGAVAEPVIDGVKEGVSRSAPGTVADTLRVIPGSLGEAAHLFGALALTHQQQHQIPWRTGSAAAVSA